MLNSLPHSCEGQTTLGGRTFEKGVWYYSGIEMIDHHDLSGFENPWAAMETAFGRETRPQLFINILNRLRTLDYSQDSSATRAANQVCNRCKNNRKA